MPEFETLGKDATKLWTKWYSSTFVLFEIIKSLKHRELAWLKDKVPRETEEYTPVAMRLLFTSSLDFLIKQMNHFHFLKKSWCMYYSVATLEKIPLISWNPREQRLIRADFFGAYRKHMVKFDFVIDIDSQFIEKAYEDAKKVKFHLDKHGVPYSLRWSGLHGFHFVVEHDSFFPSDWSLDICIGKAKLIAKNLKNVLDLTRVDTQIYNDNRLLKIPYSLAGLNVCLPLSDKDFKNFSIEKMRVDYVLDNINVKNRGLLTREGTKINSSSYLNVWGEDVNG